MDEGEFDDILTSIKLDDIGQQVSALTNCTLANFVDFLGNVRIYADLTTILLTFLQSVYGCNWGLWVLLCCVRIYNLPFHQKIQTRLHNALFRSAKTSQ